MEKYKKYKEAFPNKTDAQIIESLAWELSDKVETIHKLLAEIELLQNPVGVKGGVRRSLLYKNEEDVKHSVDIKISPDGKLKLLFSADCGKFGTDEPLDEYELTVKELLLILQK